MHDRCAERISEIAARVCRCLSCRPSLNELQRLAAIGLRHEEAGSGAAPRLLPGDFDHVGIDLWERGTDDGSALERVQAAIDALRAEAAGSSTGRKEPQSEPGLCGECNGRGSFPVPGKQERRTICAGCDGSGWKMPQVDAGLCGECNGVDVGMAHWVCPACKGTCRKEPSR